MTDRDLSLTVHKLLDEHGVERSAPLEDISAAIGVPVEYGINESAYLRDGVLVVPFSMPAHDADLRIATVIADTLSQKYRRNRPVYGKRIEPDQIFDAIKSLMILTDSRMDGLEDMPDDKVARMYRVRPNDVMVRRSLIPANQL